MPAAQSNNTREAFSLHTLKEFLRSIGWSGSLEQEQSVLRIIISLSFVGYLLFNKPTVEENLQLWTIGLWFILTFLTFATILFVTTLKHPQPSVIRRIIGIVSDIGALSYGLYLTGPMGAPWYGVFLWVTLGNGFRYGENYL